VAGDGADRRLVLFIEGEADLDAVGERILEELPSYMRPARIHAIERIPTTASGKTDRDALVRLADEPVPDPVASDYADQLERELAEIWGEILGVDGIPREDAVLQHGAHSLNIFTALAQVQERYGVAVPMADFFRSPTIATLARLVRGA
jgi:acyl carrier protein